MQTVHSLLFYWVIVHVAHFYILHVVGTTQFVLFNMYPYMHTVHTVVGVVSHYRQFGGHATHVGLTDGDVRRVLHARHEVLVEHARHPIAQA